MCICRDRIPDITQLTEYYYNENICILHAQLKLTCFPEINYTEGKYTTTVSYNKSTYISMGLHVVEQVF